MVKTVTGSAAARDSDGSGGDVVSADPWEPDGTGAAIMKRIFISERYTSLRKKLSTSLTIS